MREDFSEFDLPAGVVLAYPPDRAGLFDRVRREVSDRMLKVVAESDYGYLAGENLAALKALRDGTAPKASMEWVPNEVLCLFAWSEHRTEQQLKDVREFHLTRAFCCGCLLEIPDVNENRARFSTDRQVALIESVLILGEEYQRLLASQLVWMIEEMKPWEEEFLFAGFGLLATLKLGELRPEADVVKALGEWLVRANEAALPWHEDMTYSNPQTFLDLRFVGVSSASWRRLAGRMEAGRGEESLAALLEKLCVGKTTAQKSEDVKAAVSLTKGLSFFLVQEAWRAFKEKWRR